jgi:hypothetical protein
MQVAGVRLRVLDRLHYDPPRTALALLAAMTDSSGVPVFSSDIRHFDRLAGDGGRAREVLAISGRSSGPRRSSLLRDWTLAARRFQDRRRSFLLYP